MFFLASVILFTGWGGSLCPGGILPDRDSPGQRPPLDRYPPRQRPSPLTVKSGRYASYWNAFLFYNCAGQLDFMLLQGGHDTGKTGNLVLTFSRQGKHREFYFDTGKNFETQGKYVFVTQGKYLTLIIKIKSMFIFLDFKKNFSLALLGISLHFKVLSTFASKSFICYCTCVFTL